MFDWVLSTLLFMKKIAGKKKLNLFTWATSARKFKYFLFRLCLKWSIIMQLVMTFRILVLMTLKWWTCRVMKVRVWLVEILLIANVRSSHRRCSVRKGVLRNFAKFTGKHLCQSLFLIKLQAQASTLLQNTFFTEHLWALLQIAHLKRLVSTKRSYIHERSIWKLPVCLSMFDPLMGTSRSKINAN